MIDWLIDWFIDWLISILIDWLINLILLQPERYSNKNKVHWYHVNPDVSTLNLYKDIKLKKKKLGHKKASLQPQKLIVIAVSFIFYFKAF